MRFVEEEEEEEESDDPEPDRSFDPLNLNDYLPECSVEQAADAAQDAYERAHLGLEREQP